MNFPFEENILLENDRVKLRPINLSDITNLQQVATQEIGEVSFSFSPLPTDIELLTNFVKKGIENRNNRFRYTFVIYDKKLQAYAGSTSFLNISESNETVEIGSTWYGKPYRKTGLNRNCKYLLLDFAFSQLKVQRVEFKTDERNVISRNAIEKLGARYEGTLRKHMKTYEGFQRNTVYYSILPEEWVTLKPHFLENKNPK